MLQKIKSILYLVKPVSYFLQMEIRRITRRYIMHATTVTEMHASYRVQPCFAACPQDTTLHKTDIISIDIITIDIKLETGGMVLQWEH